MHLFKWYMLVKFTNHYFLYIEGNWCEHFGRQLVYNYELPIIGHTYCVKCILTFLFTIRLEAIHKIFCKGTTMHRSVFSLSYYFPFTFVGFYCARIWCI